MKAGSEKCNFYSQLTIHISDQLMWCMTIMTRFLKIFIASPKHISCFVVCVCMFYTAYVVLVYCEHGGWTWWDWSLVLRTHHPSVQWHCWLGHLTSKTRPWYDLYCVWWDVKSCSINQSCRSVVSVLVTRVIPAKTAEPIKYDSH